MWPLFSQGFRLAEEDQEGRGLSSEERQVSGGTSWSSVSNFHLPLGDVDRPTFISLGLSQ